jgi:hypothetical protein
VSIDIQKLESMGLFSYRVPALNTKSILVIGSVPPSIRNIFEFCGPVNSSTSKAEVKLRGAINGATDLFIQPLI